MRIVSFIIAVLLVLVGGGCTVAWISTLVNSRAHDMGLFLIGFGLIPLIGGILLFRYAWRDRG